MESTRRVPDDAAAELRRTTRVGLVALVGIAITVIAILVVSYGAGTGSAQGRRNEWAAMLVVGLGIGVALLTMHRMHRDLTTEARAIDMQRDALDLRTGELEARAADVHVQTAETEQKNAALVTALDEAHRARLRAEALVRQKARVAAVLDSALSNAPVGFGFLDEQLRFLRVNAAFARFNDLLPEDHVGLPIRELDGELADVVEPVLRQVLATRQPVVNVELTTRPKRRTADRCHWLTSYFPIDAIQGHTPGIAVIVVDVAGQRQVEARD